MSTFELPTMPWESRSSAASGVESIRPAEFHFAESFIESACAVSIQSPLEYSLREACLPELNARLRAEGFEPPGKGLAAWVRLARVVQVDPASVTDEELVAKASAWEGQVAFTHAIWTRDPR